MIYLTGQMKAPKLRRHFCFYLSLLALVVLFLANRQHKTAGSVRLPFPNGFLQHTSAGHIMRFTPDAVYVAGASHVLRIEL